MIETEMTSITKGCNVLSQEQELQLRKEMLSDTELIGQPFFALLTLSLELQREFK